MDARKPILLVEDDMVDSMTIEKALKDELKITNPLVKTSNGEEALEYLRAPQNEKPGLILLDLNMPKMNGLEFLAIAKRNAEWKLIPVVVLTTSNEEKDRVQSFDMGVAGYMIKPVDYAQFVEVVKTIGLYWTLSETPD